MEKKRGLSTHRLITSVGFLLLFIVFSFNLSTVSRIASNSIIRSFPLREASLRCDRSHDLYDICFIDGSTVLDSRTFTLSGFRRTARPSSSLPSTIKTEKVRPYPRKTDPLVMPQIKEVTLDLASIPATRSGLTCAVRHDAPALVFSAAGYTGNFFHDFNDVFIPLYITANSVFPGRPRDVVLVVTETFRGWALKYNDLLRAFSTHPLVLLQNDTVTHCFPSAAVGLISHGFMTINRDLIPAGRGFTHFGAFLGAAYGGGAWRRVLGGKHGPARPRLALASRRGSTGRVLLNLVEVKRAAEEAGFEVVLFEPNPYTQLWEAREVVRPCHALVGVHGAALTHGMFLRRGAVVLQVVPIGLHWAADAFFGRAVRGLELEYMEYWVTAEESSLTERFGRESRLVKDPFGLQKGGWPSEIMDIYLKEQDVRLNLTRFRPYLQQVFEKAKLFMEREG